MDAMIKSRRPSSWAMRDLDLIDESVSYRLN
jgi:hypothetical protein